MDSYSFILRLMFMIQLTSESAIWLSEVLTDLAATEDWENDLANSVLSKVAEEVHWDFKTRKYYGKAAKFSVTCK